MRTSAASAAAAAGLLAACPDVVPWRAGGGRECRRGRSLGRRRVQRRDAQALQAAAQLCGDVAGRLRRFGGAARPVRGRPGSGARRRLLRQLLRWVEAGRKAAALCGGGRTAAAGSGTACPPAASGPRRRPRQSGVSVCRRALRRRHTAAAGGQAGLQHRLQQPQRPARVVQRREQAPQRPHSVCFASLLRRESQRRHTLQ